MKKIILIFSLIIFAFSCTDEFESDFLVDKESLYQNWELQDVEFITSSGESSIYIPSFTNSIQLNKGGTYETYDEESMIQLFPADYNEFPSLGLWEFPIESSADQILFDKGVSTYSEFGFWDSYLFYRIEANPIDLFFYELKDNKTTLSLETSNTDKIYNYAFVYSLNFFYSNYTSELIDENSTYEEGKLWGEIIGYYMAVSDAADEFSNESLYHLDLFSVSIGDGVYQYNEDADIFSIAASNPFFENGFYEGFDIGYNEGYEYFLNSYMDTNRAPSLVLNFKKK